MRSRLGLDEKGVTALTYVLLAAILLFFTRDSFWNATTLIAGSAIMPLFEELFFRAYLLGSMVEEWPLLSHLPHTERIKLVRQALLPLFLTSISFALVHDDVISVLLSLPLIDFNSVVIILMRFFFGMAVGDLYIFRRNLIVPAAFHVAFNLSYFLLAG